MGVLGNVVVSLGWFGPHAASVVSFPVALLVGFVVSQVALFFVGFVPAGVLGRAQR